jgi:hypothetical protein
MIVVAFRFLAVGFLASTLVSDRLWADESKKDDDAAKKDEQAKELAVRFMKAYKDKDLDAMMKMVDVPWYDEPGKPVVMKEKDEVKQFLQWHIDREDKPEWIPIEAVQIMTYSTHRKQRTDPSEERFVKAEDAVFAADDRIVLVARPNDKRPRLGVGIRFREGKPFVCAAFK